EFPGRGSEHLLLFGEGEIHRRKSVRAGRSGVDTMLRPRLTESLANGWSLWRRPHDPLLPAVFGTGPWASCRVERRHLAVTMTLLVLNMYDPIPSLPQAQHPLRRGIGACASSTPISSSAA